MENNLKNVNKKKKNKIIKEKDSPNKIKEKDKNINNMNKKYYKTIHKKKLSSIINNNELEKFKDKKESIPVVYTIQNFYTNKNNKSVKILEFPNKLESSIYNENIYLTKRNKINNFHFSNKKDGDKEKNLKANLNDLFIPINQYKFKNIRNKLNNQSNKKMNISYYSDNNDNNIENDDNSKTIRKRKIFIDWNKNLNHTIKIKKKKKSSSKNYKQDNNGINKEYFRSYIVNKYSTSFVNDPRKFEEKFNFLSEKRKNVKKLEDKKIIKPKKNNKNCLNYFDSKYINVYQKQYCPTLANHKIKKENSKKIINIK